MQDRIKNLPRWAQDRIQNQKEVIDDLRQRVELYEAEGVIKDPRNTDGTTGIALGKRPTSHVFVTPKNGELIIEGYGMINVHPIAPNKVSIRPL
jgi:hypothetical protein